VLTIVTPQPLIPLLAQQFQNIRELTLQFIYGINQIQVWCAFSSSSITHPQWYYLKTDLGFISSYRRLKIIRMYSSTWVDLDMWEGFKSQVKDALLDLQKDDKEEKTIVLRIYSQPKKIITLPWPPIFRL
jgi:hypothetical protein